MPAGADSGYDIPVIVINGARPGPMVALIAGLHGAEFAGIVALQRLAAELNPGRLQGSVVIVPVVNTAGFERITPRVNPVDGKNMNRFFPGDPQGAQTERAAFELTRHVLSRADYVIDYHGGDLNEDQPYAYWIQTKNEVLNATEHDMLLAFGAPYIIKFPWLNPSPASAKLLPTQAVALGKPTITVDAGRAGTFTDGDIALLVDGTKRVLGRLGVAPPPGGGPRPPIVLERTIYVNATVTGVFHPAVERGVRVKKGQILGYVVDYYGRRRTDVTAPEDGIVLYLNSTPSAVTGEQLFFLGVEDPSRSSTSARARSNRAG